VRFQVERAEERREDAHRVAARADIVREPGERQRGGSGPAPDLVACFEHPHREAAARELDRRGQSVRTGADDDGVVHAHTSP
jgi:hypothetical protein